MITYGDGDLLLSSNEKMIEIKYEGVISITERPDGIIIDGSRRELSIYMKSGESLPELLLTYKGTFKITSVRGFEDGQAHIVSTAALGLDFWKEDAGVWGEDTSLWGAVTNNYKVGFPQRYRPEQFDNIIKPKAEKTLGFNGNKTSNNRIKGGY